jgi:hypothetical protein
MRSDLPKSDKEAPSILPAGLILMKEINERQMARPFILIFKSI